MSAGDEQQGRLEQRIARIRSEMHQLVEELEGLTGSAHMDTAPPAPPVGPAVGSAVFLPSPAMMDDPICPDSGGMESIARRLLRQARLREAFFDGDLFADVAWNMLLD